jgi:Fe-S-cluster containining protein
VPDDLKQAVLPASKRPEVRAAIANLYAELQHQIDSRKPLCVLSGRCCRFEEFGHRLYVTTLELAAFLYNLNTPLQTPWDGTGCPFQQTKLCTVHPIRPFGCRIFFCDSTATDWQQEQYQLFHARLRQLHTDLAVPYAYVEWRQALQQTLGIEASDAPPTLPDKPFPF